MCLSTVYEVNNETEKLVCQYVSEMSAKEDIVRMTDITGNEIELRGTIKSIDLIKNIIRVEVSK